MESIIKDYIEKNKPKLYILTPCYGSSCFVSYMTSLINTIQMLTQLGMQYHVEYCCNDSLVPRARNNLIARAMNDKDMTHVIFIDADITWNPTDILKLLMADKPIIGGIYPLKRYNWSKLTEDTNKVQEWMDRRNNHELTKSLTTPESYLQYNMLTYNVNYSSASLVVKNNLLELKHLATGFMMIQRNCLKQMMDAFPHTKYTDDVGYLKAEENEFAYALFDTDVEDGHYLSEDWLFCSRWSRLGGSILADVSINLTHTGIEPYSGSYISSIQLQKEN